VTVKPMTSAHLIHLLSAHVAWPLTGWGWCIGPTRRTIPFGENEGSGESVRVRKHWHDLSYWRWLWHGRVPFRAKVAIGAALLAGLLGGGWLAADRLSSSHASATNTDSFVFETTVRQVVTVPGKGKVTRKVVRVVRRVYVPAKTTLERQTRYSTRLITAPGTIRVVRRLITKFVPVVRKRVVTVNGKSRTVVETKLVPTTRVETETRVVTNNQTVTDTQNVTQAITTTQHETKTVPTTVTQHETTTVTDHETTTVEKTVTETQTQTQTETQTVTETETETGTVTETKIGP